MKLIFTPEAWQDLLNACDYIELQNPKAAEKFKAELMSRMQTIVATPYAFALFSRYEHLNLRRFIYNHYSIFYHVTESHVIVTNIIHHSQDLASILGKE
jgi:plasmid stabilization system protein ParE